MVIEKLERRQLLSTTASVDAHGVLVVQLDNSAVNTVAVNEHSNGFADTSLDYAVVTDANLPGGSITFLGVKGIKVLGGTGNDNITVTLDNVPVTIASGDGNDTIGVSADVFQPGIDTFGSGSVVDGGNGTNLIVVGGVNNSVVTGGDGNDMIIVGAFDIGTAILGGNNMTVKGNGGDDTIYSGYTSLAGLTNSTLDGGTGNDTITDVGSNNRINGGAGSDIITAVISDFVVPAHGDVITRI